VCPPANASPPAMTCHHRPMTGLADRPTGQPPRYRPALTTARYPAGRLPATGTGYSGQPTAWPGRPAWPGQPGSQPCGWPARPIVLIQIPVF